MATRTNSGKTVEGSRHNKRRRSGVEVRQARRDALTPNEQLLALNARLGVGVGAVRERARLAALANA